MKHGKTAGTLVLFLVVAVSICFASGGEVVWDPGEGITATYGGIEAGHAPRGSSFVWIQPGEQLNLKITAKDLDHWTQVCGTQSGTAEDTLTYWWSPVSGSGWVFSNRNSAEVQFSGQANVTYVLQVAVNDAPSDPNRDDAAPLVCQITVKVAAVSPDLQIVDAGSSSVSESVLWSRRAYNPPSSETPPVPWLNRTAGFHVFKFSVTGTPHPEDVTGLFVHEGGGFTGGEESLEEFAGTTQDGFIVGQSAEGYMEVVYGSNPPQVIEHCPRTVNANQFCDTLSVFNGGQFYPVAGVPVGTTHTATATRTFFFDGQVEAPYFNQYTIRMILRQWTLPGLTITLPNDARWYYDIAW
jgi:hypothetical protein